MTSVLVVIPTLNEERNIERVLDTLLADLPEHLDLTCIVADGGSQDGTRNIVQRRAASNPRIRLLHNPKRRQAAAVNLAVQEFGAGFDILIRCDAHAEYPAGFIPHLVESLDVHQADAVVVPMDSIGHTCLGRAIAWVSDSKIGSGGSAHRGGTQSGFVDHGHHAAFRLASFVRAGGYDESFSHNEDAELDCRQRAMGSRIFLDAGIRLNYHPRATLAALGRQYFNYGRGRSRTVRKHPGSMRMRQLAVPVHLVTSLLSLALAVITPWALIWPAVYLLALLMASLAITWQQSSACGLLAAPAAAVMHTAWACGFFTGLLVDRQPVWSRPAHGRPRVAYFLHHVEDSAYRRRIAMLEEGGADVVALGFAREADAAPRIGSAPLIVLGHTQAARFSHRIMAVCKALLMLPRWSVHLAGCEVIMARNLECLLLAVCARAWRGQGQAIHYEVLDIHRLMLREDRIGRALRSLEGWLLRRCGGLIVSSPAFDQQYFQRFHAHRPTCLLLENKVYPAVEGGQPVAPNPLPGPTPLRIGWFGVIRCRKSLLMLAQLVEQSHGQIEVHIRGKVAATAIPDFDAVLQRHAGLHFHGPYRNPEDLGRIYGEVDVAWAIDFFEEGQNSLWLLPNRLYESCANGCVPLALSGTQTNRWLQDHGLGLTLEHFDLDTLVNCLSAFTPDALRRARQAIADQPTDRFQATRRACEDLVARLIQAQRAPMSLATTSVR